MGLLRLKESDRWPFGGLPPSIPGEEDDLPHFSYAAPEDAKPKRFLIQTIEKVTGQPRLKKLYLEHRRTGSPDEVFWHAAVRKLDLRVTFDKSKLDAIPKEGPLVIVANHPYGVLDGIVISYLTSLVRPTFKVLTNSVLYRAPEIRPYLLPIDFAETKEAIRTNLESRKKAIEELSAGGAVVVFPGGTVSTSEKPYRGPAVDPDWKPFTAKLITQSKAAVLPMYFEGQNSRLFQIASHLHYVLRISLLFKEVADRIGTEMPVRIGDIMPYEALAHLKDRQALVDHLRELTYNLGGRRNVGKLRLYEQEREVRW